MQMSEIYFRLKTGYVYVTVPNLRRFHNATGSTWSNRLPMFSVNEIKLLGTFKHLEIIRLFHPVEPWTHKPHRWARFCFRLSNAHHFGRATLSCPERRSLSSARSCVRMCSVHLPPRGLVLSARARWEDSVGLRIAALVFDRPSLSILFWLTHTGVEPFPTNSTI